MRDQGLDRLPPDALYAHLFLRPRPTACHLLRHFGFRSPCTNVAARLQQFIFSTQTISVPPAERGPRNFLRYPTSYAWILGRTFARHARELFRHGPANV